VVLSCNKKSIDFFLGGIGHNLGTLQYKELIMNRFEID